ncbi:unnamed protein product, partial [Oppiella nova]
MSDTNGGHNQSCHQSSHRCSSLPSVSATARQSDPTTGTSSAPTSRPKMDVVCLIDLTIGSPTLSHRKAALEEIKRAAHLCNANLHHIQFQKLDF